MLVVFEIFIELFGHVVVLCEKDSKSAGGWYVVDSSVPQLLPFLYDRVILCIGNSAPTQDEAGIVELSKTCSIRSKCLESRLQEHLPS
jgi:hypothetical protein